MGKSTTISSTKLVGTVDNEIAERWHENFKNRQHPFITDIIPGHDVKFGPYDSTGFITMLEEINNSVATGMRVYFACYEDTKDGTLNEELIPKNSKGIFAFGHMTLIYARTIKKYSSNRRDDETYYIMKPDSASFTTISTEIASLWVSKYEKTIHATLSNIGNLGSSGETRQLWYSKAIMDENITGLRSGTIDPGSLVTVFIGAYNANETINCCNQNGRRTLLDVHNQLNLIFCTGDMPYTEQKDFGMVLSYLLGPGDDYDTGIPIPPASPGGDLLP